MGSFDDAEWDRTVVVIDRLVTLGLSARLPLSKSLGGGPFELRFALGPTARRITYRFRKDGRIILLTHLLQATQQRTHRDRPGPRRPLRPAPSGTREGDDDGQLLRWDDIKKQRPGPDAETAQASSRTSRSAS